MFYPTTPRDRSLRFGLLPFRSPLLRKSHSFSFPPGTEMFHFPEFAPYIIGYLGITPSGFPHSDISGSKPDWRLPEAYRSQSASFFAS